jgi:hypothetical protein
VEILIAIVLVGVLAAVAVVGIGRLTQQTSAATCAQSEDASRIAAGSFYAGHLRYPTSFAELTASTAGGDGALVLPGGVTSGAATISGRGWVLTMVPGTPPTFSCATPGAVTSTTTTTAATSVAATTTTVAANGVTAVGSTAGDGTYYGERIVTLTNPAPITALTVTINVRQTTGVTYSGSYTDFWGGAIGSSSTTSNDVIVYTFALNPGQTIVPGTWKLDAQWSGTGSPHPTAGDTWQVVTTSQGRTTTLGGTY